MYKYPSLAPPKISLPSEEKATENIQNLRLVLTRHKGICLSGSPLTEHKCTERNHFELSISDNNFIKSQQQSLLYEPLIFLKLILVLRNVI